MNLFIMPHPPILVEEIGKDQKKAASETVAGMEKIAEDIKAIAPKTIAIISPHGNVFSDGLCINIEDDISGSFVEYKQPSIRCDLKGDRQRALVICSGLRAADINCLALDKISAEKYNISTTLDHGALVPLYYILKQYTDFKLLHINIGFLPKAQMYKAGKIIADILGEDNVMIASGDLSHKLSTSGPYGYDKMGKTYDEYIVNAVKMDDYLKILSADGEMLEKAAQCAHKPLEMLTGALDGCSSKSSVYSYEAPFGIGYMTVKILRDNSDKSNLIDQYLEIKKEKDKNERAKEDEYVKLARNTIEQYVKHRTKRAIPENLSEELYIKQKGIFVSIKKEGKLRGCIGTIEPTKDSIAKEIIDNAIAAATRDPRFSEVQEDELRELDISVDILSVPEDILDKSKLDIKEYGVIVRKDFRRGLLLPNIEGVHSVDEQIAIALQKAEIKPDEEYTMQRFMVTRHK